MQWSGLALKVMNRNYIWVKRETFGSRALSSWLGWFRRERRFTFLYLRIVVAGLFFFGWNPTYASFSQSQYVDRLVHIFTCSRDLNQYQESNSFGCAVS